MSRPSRYWLLLLTIVVWPAFANQTLIGAAEYTRYKRSYYIGGLYALAEADKEEVYTGSAPASMRLLVTAKRLSKRDFQNSWVQSIAVNNDQQVLEANTRDVLQFSNVLQNSLVTGDMIEIITDGKTKVSVDINGVTVSTFDSPQLFPLLLKTWIGPVPPSTPFKNGIRGKDTPEPALVAQLNDHQVTSERVSAIKGWLAPAATTAVAKASPAPVKPAPSKPTPTKQTAVKPAPAKPVSVAAAPQKPQPEIESASKKSTPPAAPSAPPAEKVAASKQVAQQNKPATQPQAVAASKPAVAAKPATAKTAPAAAPVTGVDSLGQAAPDVSEPELSEDQLVEQLLIRQRYLNDLQSAIDVYKHVPQQAIMRRVSGEVRVSVDIDRGGRVLAMDLVEASKYNFFNQQAQQAINKAAPFDPVPDALPGDTFTFEVLLYYPPYF